MVNLGNRLEPFVDEALIAKKRNLALKVHTPVVQDVAIRFNRTWEGAHSYYCTVLQDRETYRLYYRGWPSLEADEEVTCFTQSKDGIHWRRPVTGLFEHRGSRINNIIWSDHLAEGRLSHNFAPFIDTNPATPPEERYKAVAGMPLHGLVSADGINWRLIRPEPIITQGAFDSHNVAMWDAVRGEYVAYVRIFSDGVRAIARTTSPDFLNWSDSVELDMGDCPKEHLYTNSIIPYPNAPHIYLGFPKRYMPDRQLIPDHCSPGISDAVFMTSRDGITWNRRLEAFIRPGLDPLNWGDRNIHVAHGIVQTSPEEFSLYFTEHYRTKKALLRRATVRREGFVSVNANYGGGEFTTVPLTFSGSHLVINYSTSAAGSILVEIRDANDKPIKNFSLRSCREIYGDHIERVVTWNKGSDISHLAGKPISLRFVMKDADLFSLRFAEKGDF